MTGRFGEGDTVDVTGTDGVTFARGMVFVEAADLRTVAGRHTSDLPAGMAHEVIHRDDLVLLPGLDRLSGLAFVGRTGIRTSRCNEWRSAHLPEEMS